MITGASSGIGREMARQLAADGTALVIVARSEERLTDLAKELGVEVQVMVADLSERPQVDWVAERLAASDKPIDLLVNNAGFGHTGEFADLDIDDESSVIDVNIQALSRLSHAAAGVMRERGHGGILNVSSVAAFAPSARSATYSATKAFVSSFTDGLHQELTPHGVHVSALCPGLTRTEFQERANYDTSGIPDALWQEADVVAAAGLAAVAKNKASVVTGAQNKVAAGFLKVAPGGVRRFATEKLNQK